MYWTVKYEYECKYIASEYEYKYLKIVLEYYYMQDSDQLHL